MNDIKNKIKELLKFKKARYITVEYIQKVYGEDFYNNILSYTSFFESGHTLSERLFCCIYGITEHIKCLHCHKDINKFEKFYDTKEEYIERFCTHSCIRSYMYDMTSLPVIDILNISNFEHLITSGNLNILRLKPSFMNKVKIILHEKNIDFRLMTALEALYFLRNKLDNNPKCYCGKDVQYLGKGKYRKYCSNICKANSEIQEELKKNTCIKKYGTINVFQNDNIKNKIKATNIKKYGMDHYCKTAEYRERLKNGNIIKSSINYDIIRQKHFDTTFEKFEKFKDILNIIPLFKREDYNGSGYHKLYLWKCVKCGTEFEHWYYEINKLKCPKCNTNTNIEQTIINFLSSLNQKLLIKNRSLIAPYELDVYLPDKKIAIEINGLYWHSQLNGTDRSYHLNKTKQCEKQGIKLIHLFADEIMFQLPIVKARLKHIIGITSGRIYARKCEVKNISTQLKNKFLNKYHIQGEDKSAINLGLFYKNRLAATMTFSKLRKVLASNHKSGEYELSRYAAINHFVIVGGADKIFKHFEREYNPIRVITYADRRWSQGNLYYKLGFNLDHISPPNHWYTKDYLHRIYRYNFRKNVLKDKLPIFDNNLSEWQNMQLNKYDRIWDCGNLVFVKNFDKIT